MDVIHEVMTETQAGRMTFPDVVRRLLEAGVESYLVDFPARRETFYMSDGKTQTVALTLKSGAVAEEFSSSELLAAIRGAQADMVRYPEFVKLSTAAGVAAYWAFLKCTWRCFLAPTPRGPGTCPKRLFHLGRQFDEAVVRATKPWKCTPASRDCECARPDDVSLALVSLEERSWPVQTAGTGLIL